jgi:multidrug efflux pump
MMLSDIAVRRPVFAAVAAIVLCVIGAAAFFFLPVRELPDVDPPIVSVSTSYAGASAEVIESRITEPIEQQIAGIQGVERISSSSRDGRSNVSIEFSLDRNIDDAANDVRDRVSRVVGRLPDQARPPEVSKADSDSQPIMILFLRSTSMNRLELTDYADRYLIDRLATVPGVAQVQTFGEQRYAMRIWLDAGALAARGLTVSDVETALTAQNVELPAGQLESGQKDYTVRVARTYARAEDFRQLPIGTRGSGTAATAQAGGGTTVPSGASGAIQGQSGYVTRLGDIARIVEAPAEDRRLFRGNGQDQIGLAVTRQAQANDLAISEGVQAMLDEVRPSLPEGTELSIGSDNSVFTSHAIDEVWITIGISLALVALVNFIFLGSVRAAFIPSIVAPICLLATFIILAPLGFSLNLLTLLALVLAIGLVVDDAIVVTENIQRRLDHGEPPLVAAERGARQVFFAVVATTVVLLAVFAPLLFLPGYVGRLFVELAATIAAAVAFSAFLALTLSPMLASRILRPAQSAGWAARKVDRVMDALRNSYQNSLQAMLGKRIAVVGMVGLIVAVAGGAAFMFLTLPNELVPAEDRGRVQIRVQGPEGAGFDYTRNIMMGIEPILAGYKASGEASSFLISAPGFGGGSFNAGNGSLILSDWSERDRSAADIAQELNGKLRGQTDAQVNASVPGAFQRGGGGGGGGGGSNSIEMVVTGAEYEDIYKWLQPVLAASLENPGFSRPRLNYEPNAPRLLVDVDPEKAAALGVSSQAVGRTLETMFGSRRATTYLRGGQEYDVILQTERSDRRSVADLEALYVATGSGQLVPLSAVVTTETSGDTPDRRRLDRQRAISISADLNPGTTLVDATEFMTRVAQEQPQGVVTTQWGGAARDQQEAGGAVAAAFGLALLLVFLVLAAQFESWITPAVIMLTVPLAAAGGLFGLVMAGSSLNIYSQIGLIILIGVAAKNGILIVEFANQLRDQGRSIQEAIIESSTLRLRPIIMTSIATAFGALPLVLWQGAGAGSRQTIGVVIFAGAMFATLLTLFVVPVIYGALARFTKSPEYTARKIEEWEAQEARANHAVPAAAE